jgi:hypothetical protein
MEIPTTERAPKDDPGDDDEGDFQAYAYHPEEFERDNGFYVRYYTPIWNAETAAAADVLKNACSPNMTPAGPQKTVDTRARDVRKKKREAIAPFLYTADTCQPLPACHRAEWLDMVTMIVKDVQIKSHKAGQPLITPDWNMEYYTGRLTMLVGIIHPTTIALWKRGDLARYTLIGLLGLFRRTLILHGCVLWVADPWLTALPVPVEKLAFRHPVHQKAWASIAHCFETQVSHFIDLINKSAIPTVALKTLFHCTPGDAPG